MATKTFPTICKLAELDSIKEDALPKTYVVNVERICGYTDDNITAALNPIKANILNSVREELISEVTIKLPTYANKIGRKGQVKSKVIKDIIALSKSIVKTLPDPDLDSVYKEIVPQLDLTNQETLRAYLEKLEKKIESTQSELDSTRSKLSEVETAQNKLKAENENLWEIVRTSQIDQKIYNRVERPVSSDTSDNSNSDADCESDASVVSQPQNNRSKIKKNTLKGQPKQLEGVVRKGFAFVGNLTEGCTPKVVLRHIKKYSKVKMEINDIQEIETKSSAKAFKVAVDKNELQDFISKTKWPSHVRVEPFAPPRRKNVKPRKTKGPNRSNSKVTYRRDQKFLANNRRASHRPSESSYWQNSYSQDRNDYQPRGYDSGYYRSDYRY